MAGRRANGEGSVYQRKSDGRWIAALILDDGKRVVRSAKTRAAAREKLAALTRSRDENLPIVGDRSTGVFLQQWLDIAQTAVRPGTFERYEEYIRLHAMPALGRVKLGRLMPEHFQRLYQAKLKAGLSPPRSTTCTPWCTRRCSRRSAGA
jgi:integrase